MTNDNNNTYGVKFSSAPEIIKQKSRTATTIEINKNLILGDASQIEAKRMRNHVPEVKRTAATVVKDSVERDQ
jgi:hypothetical protein